MRGLIGKMKGKLREEGGFSMVELIVASILLFVLTFSAYNFAGSGASLAKNSVARAEVNQELRETLETMTRQIRVAHFFEPGECTTTQIGFYSYATGDAANTNYYIEYELIGTDLMRGQISDTASSYEVMARGVQSVNFSYYQADGTETSANPNAPDTTLIARVDISMTMVRTYQKAIGSESKGHRQYVEDSAVSASGTDSVAIRNTLTLTSNR